MTTQASPDNAQQGLHVVTENGDQCFRWQANQLTYIAPDRRELPAILATKFGPLATRLDLSYNSLSSFESINLFFNLSELILDNNDFCDDDLDFQQNLRLKTLSLNKNKLKDLHRLLQSIKFNFPNLEYLSSIGNPFCPVGFDPVKLDQRQTTCPSRTQPKNDSLDKKQRLLSIDELLLMKSSLATKDNMGVHSKILSGRSEVELEDVEMNYRKYRHFVIYHLPNLRFLDSCQIRVDEREEALAHGSLLNAQSALEREPCRPSGQLAQLKAQTGHITRSRVNQDFELRIMTTESGEDNVNHCEVLSQGIRENSSTVKRNTTKETRQQPARKGMFSKLTYKYTGKNSEGNRFIRDHDL